MQQTLIVGDTLAFTTTLPDYPASDGWTLTYQLVPFPVAAGGPAGGTPIPITASANGDAYDVAVSATVTALWLAGEYSWATCVTLGSERYTVEGWTSQDGRFGGGSSITLKADPIAATTFDNRSQARKAVDDLRTALATYTASQGTIAEYEIAGRRMKFKDSADILQLLSYWETTLQREEAAAAIAAGRPNPRRYFLRFGRA